VVIGQSGAARLGLRTCCWAILRDLAFDRDLVEISPWAVAAAQLGSDGRVRQVRAGGASQFVEQPGVQLVLGQAIEDEAGYLDRVHGAPDHGLRNPILLRLLPMQAESPSSSRPNGAGWWQVAYWGCCLRGTSTLPAMAGRPGAW
jgi:hypothetical protein